MFFIAYSPMNYWLAVPSGPAAYVFDESGQMVEWSWDPGDDLDFQEKWPLPQEESSVDELAMLGFSDFSEVKKADFLQSGNCVFVFVYAELNPSSSAALHALDLSQLSSIAKNGEFEFLVLRYDDWDDERIASIWREVGHTKKPFIAYYRPGKPPVALDPFSLKPLVVSYGLADGVIGRVQPEHCPG